MRSVVLLLFALSASAYEFKYVDGKPVRWEATTLTYTTVAPIALHDKQIAAALRQWSDATDGLLQFVPVDGEAQITFKNLPADGSGYVRGLASKTLRKETIVRVSVALTENTLEALQLPIWLHEIGHALGLEHTAEAAPIMNSTIEYPSDTSLHKDDIDGIRELYGLSARTTVTLTIVRERGVRYTVYINDGLAKKIRCHLKGKLFNFTFRGYSVSYQLIPKKWKKGEARTFVVEAGGAP